MRMFLVIVVAGVCCACADDAARDFGGELRQGDIVFRRGHGTKSRAVLAVDSVGAYSHVGIVCATDSGLVVVHAVPGESAGRDVVKAEWPGEFFLPDRAVGGAVCRPRSDTAVLNGAAKYALRAQRAGVEFDHDYDLSDSTAMYCTELVWRSFLAAGVDVSGGRRTHVPVPPFVGDYIMPSDIFCDTILNEIITFNLK